MVVNEHQALLLGILEISSVHVEVARELNECLVCFFELGVRRIVKNHIVCCICGLPKLVQNGVAEGKPPDARFACVTVEVVLIEAVRGLVRQIECSQRVGLAQVFWIMLRRSLVYAAIGIGM